MMTKMQAFFLGMKEFKLGITSNPGEEFIEAYDAGRELAHKLTRRKFDGA